MRDAKRIIQSLRTVGFTDTAMDPAYLSRRNTWRVLCTLRYLRHVLHLSQKQALEQILYHGVLR